MRSWWDVCPQSFMAQHNCQSDIPDDTTVQQELVPLFVLKFSPSFCSLFLTTCAQATATHILHILDIPGSKLSLKIIPFFHIIIGFLTLLSK
jgi:hypothetical protein